MKLYGKRLMALALMAAMVISLVSGIPFSKASAATTDSETVTETQTETNLLPNPGFEELDENGEPIGWSKWGTKAHTIMNVSENPDQVFEGNHSLKITDSSSTVSLGIQSDTFAIEPGVT